jgi:hypothetical protein
MDYTDLEKRYSEFKLNNLEQKLLITKAPRFVDKINLIKTEFFNPKEIIIVVGADTWERVYDAAAHKNGDIKFFEDNNVKFLVFGRNSEIKNQDSPLFLRNEIALNYSNSISSTELRKKSRSFWLYLSVPKYLWKTVFRWWQEMLPITRLEVLV